MSSMKFVAIAAVAAAACVTVPAYADGPPSWYAGAAGGPSRFNTRCDGSTVCDRSSTAWKLYGGMRYPNNTGAELVYFRLGSVNADRLDKLGVTDAQVDASFAGIAATWAPPLAAGFNANIKIGLAYSLSKVSGTSIKSGTPVDNGRSTTPHAWIGFGLAYKLTDRFDLTTDYDWTRAAYRNGPMKQTDDAGGWTLGVSYKF